MGKQWRSQGRAEAILRAEQSADTAVAPDEPAMRFSSAAYALKWAIQFLSSSQGLTRPNILWSPPRYREERPAGPAREELEDLAYTITSTLRELDRAYAATMFAVLCGDDDGGRFNDALDLVVDHVRDRIDTKLNRAQLRTLAAVALQRVRKETLRSGTLPRCAYAQEVGIQRQSASEKKWSVPINAIEDTVREWRRQGRQDLEEALADKGIIQ